MYLGDYNTTDVVYIPFHTFNSNGASVTLSGLAVTDIEVYKNGNTTQRASDSGYTLLDTDGIDFDGITGIHGISIDLSDDTDSGFYTKGSQFWVVVSAVTIDSQTVNFVAGIFTIGRVLRPTTAGNTLDVNSAGEAGIDWNNIGSPTSTVNLSNTTVGTTTTNTDMRGTDSAATAATLGTPAGADIAADIAAIKSETALIVADTNELQTDWTDGGRLDNIVDAILVDTGTTLDGKIDTIDTNVDAILVDTAEIGTAGAGLTAIWTTAITESYAADGAAVTPAQALYQLLSICGEFSVSSTTITCKKLDGSTTAMTFTLDDATSPTSRTRAT